MGRSRRQGLGRGAAMNWVRRWCRELKQDEKGGLDPVDAHTPLSALEQDGDGLLVPADHGVGAGVGRLARLVDHVVPEEDVLAGL